MRLGAQEILLGAGTRAREIFGKDSIHERHRHRYEFNPAYEKHLTDAGLRIVGRSLDGKFVEIVELPGHPWFVAVQFHPEFKSKPLRPHPLFAGFIEAARRRQLAQEGLAAANVTAIGDRRARL
jgi:CTP synthase